MHARDTRLSVAFAGVIAVLLAIPACALPTRIAPAIGSSTPAWQPSATATATAAPLPTPSPTSVSFKPGDPTATPLGSEITDPDYIEAFGLYKEQRFAQAIPLLDAVIERNPRLAPPYRYRAGAYGLVGECALGMPDVEKALSLVPDYAAAWGIRGLLLGCLGAGEEALEAYNKALSLDPSLAFVHHNLAVDYFEEGAYEQALQEYALSTSIDPTRSGGWSGQAEALRELGRYQECIEMATKALEVDLEEWIAYSDRGHCYNGILDFTAAIEDLSVYAEKYPEDPLNLYNVGIAYGERGEVFFMAGKYEEALPDLLKAAELVPGDAYNWCLLANSYFNLDRFEETLEVGEAAISINRDCGPGLYEVMARSSYALRDYEQAIEYMNEALDQQTYALGYYYRGIMYQADGQYGEAIKDLEYFLTYAPSGKEAEDARDRIAKIKG